MAFTETLSFNISKVFSETRDLVSFSPLSIFTLSPFVQTVVKFAFKKDQHKALKVCYIRTWKNSSDGELAQAAQISMEKKINGALYVTLPMEFYTDL